MRDLEKNTATANMRLYGNVAKGAKFQSAVAGYLNSWRGMKDEVCFAVKRHSVHNVTRV